jgi:fructose-1,6-bisphosphatase I
MEPHTSQPIGTPLELCLRQRAAATAQQAAATDVILALCEAAKSIAGLLAKGPLAGALGAQTGDDNADGDSQKTLDVLANDHVARALEATPARYLASEEEDAILTLSEDGLLAVAVDPLDGSSNIDANVSVGTIFSVYPASQDGASASFFRPGNEQIAAGYFVYGPHTALVLTTGNGTDLFVLDQDDQTFRLAQAELAIVPTTSEFAINASNYRHWLEPVRTFIDDCLEGIEGPRGKDFNMRWVASLVAETHRIFSRGGVFLYPADMRDAYANGRLRLIYEAAPIAMLVEQAGGLAIDGTRRILDRVPTELHQRTPLIFGSSEKVARIQNYHTDPGYRRGQSPLFRTRGLFSA